MRSSLLRGILTCTVAAVTAAPMVVSAQSGPGPTRPLLVGLGGGLTVPTGDFADGADAGYHIGGFLQYRRGTNPFGIRGELQYHRNDIKNDLFDEVGAPNDVTGHNSIFYVGAAGLLEFAPPDKDMGFFLIAGVGNYNDKVTVESGAVSASVSKSNIGFSGGGGVSFKVSSAKLMLEARIHSVKIKDTNFNFIPISLNIVF